MNECGGWSAASAELRKARFLPQAKMAYEKENFREDYDFSGSRSASITSLESKHGVKK